MSADEQLKTGEGVDAFPIPPLHRGVSIPQHQVHQILMEPYAYLMEVPGKNIRNLLIDAFQAWLNIPKDSLGVIKNIVEKLHNSSLLIDDIQDSSEVRRGRPCAHLIYGEAETINCANYVYFQAMDQCRGLRNPDAIQIFIEEMLNLHRGQGLDIFWRERLVCPSEADYRGMVMDKTGGLFRLSIRLMQCFSADRRDWTQLANNLGLFFQIRDDYVNLTDVRYHELKSFCEDLTEGKFSFPIIHAIHHRPEDGRLLRILKQRTKSKEIKLHAISYMQECGSFRYTLGVLKDLHRSIMTLIRERDGNPILEDVLRKLSADLFSAEKKFQIPSASPSASSLSSSSNSTSSSSGESIDDSPAPFAAPIAETGVEEVKNVRQQQQQQPRG